MRKRLGEATAALGLILLASPASADLALAAATDRAAGERSRAAGAVGEACQRVRWVEIRKSLRQLVAWCDDGTRAGFRIALGRAPGLAKQLRGDLRTPEGVYRVAAPARESRFHLFIPLDYPSRRDAAEALARSAISLQTYRRIVRAHEAGTLPPQDTVLGGSLGIHGEGPKRKGFSAVSDWTQGCIALSDADMERVARLLTPGTSVVIVP